MPKIAFPHSFDMRFIAALGWLGFGLAALMAFYYYSHANSAPLLSYSVKPLRSILASSALDSDFAIEYEHRPISGDVTVVKVVLWNDGNRQIAPHHVLRPIALEVEGRPQILDARVTKTTSKEIQPSLNTLASNHGRIEIAWALMESGHGLTVEVLYAGRPNAEVTLEGTIQDQGELVRHNPPEGTLYPRKIFSAEARKAMEIYGLFGAGMSFLVIIMLGAGLMGKLDGTLPKSTLLGLMLVLMACVVVIVHDVMVGYVPPPFGF